MLYLYYGLSLTLSVLTSVILTVSIFSTYWEGSSIDLKYLKENLASDLILTEYASGQFLIVLQEKSALAEWPEWPNNPGILADTHSGLWSTCLALSG